MEENNRYWLLFAVVLSLCFIFLQKSSDAIAQLIVNVPQTPLNDENGIIINEVLYSPSANNYE